MNKTILTAICGVVAGTITHTPALQARTCTGPADVAGVYGFVSARAIPPTVISSTGSLGSGSFAVGSFGAGNVSSTGTTGSSTTATGTTGTSTTGSSSTGSSSTAAASGSPLFGGTPAAGSATTTGMLVSAASGLAPFSTVGRLIIDSSGIVSATGTTTTPIQVGTVAVDQFCGVTLTISDVFGATGATGAASSSFVGFLADNGIEIDLVQAGTSTTTSTTSTTGTTGSSSSTTGSTTTAAANATSISGLFGGSSTGTGTVSGLGTSASTVTGANTGATLMLRRLFLASGCSVTTLSGSYTLRAMGTDIVSQSVTVANPSSSSGTGTTATGTTGTGSTGTGTTTGSTGTGTTATGSTTGSTTTITVTTAVPFNVLGRAFFDGNGAIVQDQSATGALVPQNQFTSGTYAVNGDCTGTMTFSGTDGRSRSANFVLNENIDPTACTTGSPVTRAPQIDFALSGANESGYGVGKRQ